MGSSRVQRENAKENETFAKAILEHEKIVSSKFIYLGYMKILLCKFFDSFSVAEKRETNNRGALA